MNPGYSGDRDGAVPLNFAILELASIRIDMASIPRFTIQCTGTEVYVRRTDTVVGGGWHAYFLDNHGKLSFQPRSGAPPPATVERTLDCHAIYGAFSLLKGKPSRIQNTFS